MKENFIIIKKNLERIIFFGLLFFLIPFLVFAQWDPNVGAGTGLPAGNIFFIVFNLMQWILGIIGFVAIIGFCIAGIIYLTSAGDEDRQRKAKQAMTYSIIGVVVALSGFVIWRAVMGMLNGYDSRF